MPLLKTNTKKKKDGVFLGVKIPEKDSTFLSLYCNAKGVSKTSVVKGLITTWTDKRNTEKMHNRLIKDTAKRIYSVWEDDLPRHKKGRKKYKDFEDFCLAILDELTDKKGLSTKDAADVLWNVKTINNEKEKNRTEKA